MNFMYFILLNKISQFSNPLKRVNVHCYISRQSLKALTRTKQIQVTNLQLYDLDTQ